MVDLHSIADPCTQHIHLFHHIFSTVLWCKFLGVYLICAVEIVVISSRASYLKRDTDGCSVSNVMVIGVSLILKFTRIPELMYYTEVLDRHTAQQFNKFIDNQQRYKIEITLYLYTWLHHTILHNHYNIEYYLLVQSLHLLQP